MGMSCTLEQGLALERLYKLHGNDGLIKSKYFIDMPGNKDYGIDNRRDMCLPVFEILDGNGYARRIGYIRIKPNGKVYMPRQIKNKLREV